MKTIDCMGCGNSMPMAETFLVSGRALCETCAAADPQAPLDPAKRVRNFDPTVCLVCGADFGSSVLATLPSGIPACEPCRQRALHWPFPQWVKAAFTVLVLLVVLSFVHNWRFVAGYRQIVRSVHAAGTGDFASAARLMEDAGRLVPEAAGLADSATLYRAVSLVQQNRNEAAIPLLQAYIARHPEAAFAAGLLLEAEYGSAFDRKDYDTFLAKAKAIAAKSPGTFHAAGSLASAYACQYAVTGREEFKRLALSQLEEAKKFAAGKPELRLEDLADRMEHRLATRRILTREEFLRQYPNGWHQGAELK